MDNYSKGKGIMTLKTNKIARKKKIKQKSKKTAQKLKEEKELADFIEKD